MKWKDCKLELPKPEDFEVIGYNKEWINEDFNPRGIRVCFIYGDGSEWCSAKWIDYHDCYQEDFDSNPTHWCKMPSFKL